MKNTLTFLTEDSFWDTDITLFPQLKDYFTLKVIVINLHTINKYSEKINIPYCSVTEFNRRYRMLNPLHILLIIKVIGKVRKSISSGILFYNFNIDPYLNLLILLFIKPDHLIISFHNFESHSDVNIIEKFLKKIVIFRYRHFHFYSKNQFNSFKKKYPNKHSIYTLMPFKDFGDKKILYNKRRKKFLFFGYIRKYKNLDLLIRVFNDLPFNDIKLVIAGNCENWNEYQKIIKNENKFELNINYIKNEDIPKFFNDADFLILPYNDASQSGPLLISFTYNLPVIASNITAFREYIIDGENGFLFQQNDSESLKLAITNAVNLPDEKYYKMRESHFKIKKQIQDDIDLNGKKIFDFISNGKDYKDNLVSQ